MMNKPPLDKLINSIGSLSKFGSRIAEAGILVLIVEVVIEVVLRAFFNVTHPLTFELACNIFLMLTAFGMAETLRADMHVRVDIIFIKLSEKTQNKLNILTTFLAIVVLILLTWHGILMTVEAYQFDYRTISVTRTPLWWTYILIPIGGILFSLEAIAKLVVYVKGLMIGN